MRVAKDKNMAFRVSLSRYGQQAEEGSIQSGCFCPVVSYESYGEAADPTARWIVLLSRIRGNSSRRPKKAGEIVETVQNQTESLSTLFNLSALHLQHYRSLNFSEG
jgi:hypothetical protein